MKNVPSLSNLAKIGGAALIAAAPMAASAQTVAGRVALPGVSAGIVPTLDTGFAPSAVPAEGFSVISLTPALSAPSAARAPSLVPVALVAQPVPATAAARMKDATAALA